MSLGVDVVRAADAAGQGHGAIGVQDDPADTRLERGISVDRRRSIVSPECHVVMIAGYATLDSAVRAVKEGAYDFLAKPFAFGQLEVVLSRIRERVALVRENRELTDQVLKAEPRARGPADTAWRLDAIDQRLGDIEQLLREVTSRLCQ